MRSFGARGAYSVASHFSRTNAAKKSNFRVSGKAFFSHSVPKNDPLFSFGVVADVQYANSPLIERRMRYEKDAINKILECVKHWKQFQTNKVPLSCVINLGDIIDSHCGDPADNEKDLKEVLRAFSTFDEAPLYHVIGNHCVRNIGCKRFREITKMPAAYYDIPMPGKWRFVFLDGTDMSKMKDCPNPDEGAAYYEKNKGLRRISSWGGGIGRSQLMWFQNIIKQSKSNNEKIIVFCHWPLVNVWHPDTDSDLLWNSDEILKALDPEVVFMWMSGHIHDNGTVVKDGIRHITLPGIVTAPPGSNAHVVASVYADRFEIEGYGMAGPLQSQIVFKLS